MSYFRHYSTHIYLEPPLVSKLLIYRGCNIKYLYCTCLLSAESVKNKFRAVLGQRSQLKRTWHEMAHYKIHTKHRFLTLIFTFLLNANHPSYHMTVNHAIHYVWYTKCWSVLCKFQARVYILEIFFSCGEISNANALAALMKLIATEFAAKLFTDFWFRLLTPSDNGLTPVRRRQVAEMGAATQAPLLHALPPYGQKNLQKC